MVGESGESNGGYGGGGSGGRNDGQQLSWSRGRHCRHRGGIRSILVSSTISETVSFGKWMAVLSGFDID